MNRLLLITLTVFIAVLAATGLCGATPVNGDISTNTTWNNAGSPYRLRDNQNGADITVRNGATLTIDSSAGPVDIEWIGRGPSTDFDLCIGNGSTQQGTLVIKAVNTINFKVKTGGNIRIRNNGQVKWTDTTAATTFTRYDSSNTWGALIFEASQTRQSEIKKCAFSYGGNDGRKAMVVVEDSTANYPTFADATFSNQAVTGAAAIRCNSKGVNALKEGNFSPLSAGGNVMSISSMDYVFYLSGVTSTAGTIRFPDVDSPDSPVNYLAGSCTVGDASNVSHWRFDDAYTFKCDTSSEIIITRGSIWGTVESKPTFQAVNASPGYADWIGLRDNQTSYDNLFGGIGPFAHLNVRDATYGVDVDKYHASASPIAGKTMRLPGITAKHCNYGIRVNNSNTGTIVVESADVGGVSGDANQTNCLRVLGGKVTVDNCDLRGVVGSGTSMIVTSSLSVGYTVNMRDARVSGPAGTGIEFGTSSAGPATVVMERCFVSGSTGTQGLGIRFYSGAVAQTYNITMRHCYVTSSAIG